MTSLILRTPCVGVLFVAGAVFLAPRGAAAQDCASDADCSAGYRCETYEYQSCSGGGMCTPDGECFDEEVICEPVQYSSCAAAPCTGDADCPARMTCHAQSYWVCDGGMAGAGGSAGAAPAAGAGGGSTGACSPDGSCDDEPVPFEEPTCWEEPGDSLCTPRHQLPCTVASDCGAGFDCIESTYWVCTGMGSAGAGGAAGVGVGGSPSMEDPGDATEPPSDEPQDDGMAPDGDFECHEEPSGQSYCQLQDLPCGADADCPDGLECKEQYVWPPCMGGAGSGEAGSAGSRPPSAPPMGGVGGGDGMDVPADDGFACPEPIVQQRCMPPEYYGGGSGGMPAPPTGGTGSGEDSGSADAGVSDPEGPGSGNAAGAGGSGPSAGGDDDSDESSDEGRGHGRGLRWLLHGCSASGPISADPLTLIAFGAIAFVMRRRARR